MYCTQCGHHGDDESFFQPAGVVCPNCGRLIQSGGAIFGVIALILGVIIAAIVGVYFLFIR